MDKSLADMTLEELWEMFPIVLSEHKSCWADWYKDEEQILIALLSGRHVKIHHIGSTAIRHIWAKPIIDILIEVPENVPLADIKDVLENNGYICMSQTDGRVSLNKGYTNRGFAERVFHIHLRRYGDHDELYFRDYMNGHPALAEEYERLKLSLWKAYEHDRDGYTNAKGPFVKKYTEEAKSIHAERDTKEERG